jgi:hypothetical protein
MFPYVKGSCWICNIINFSLIPAFLGEKNVTNEIKTRSLWKANFKSTVFSSNLKSKGMADYEREHEYRRKNFDIRCPVSLKQFTGVRE